MVQPCPECRQTRRHRLSCNAPNRARHGYGHTNDPLAIGFDTADTGITDTPTNSTTGGCDTTSDTTCSSGGGE
ncbi:hypothetical protein [Lentzea kentuckyensis]|uniref:hypothetical protein n=1 Tax=Lentzea kentuckyensis TaxID=360086 RepID=UPI000A3C1E2F|nr:hypothetical protein [Lentzea kentuckyensis]